MAQIPNFVRGRDLRYLYIVPIQTQTDGTLVIPSYFGNATYNLSGYIATGGVRLGVNPTLEMVQSIDQTIENYLLTIDSYTATVTEILRKVNVNQGSYPLILSDISTADNLLVQYAVNSTLDPATGSLVAPTIVTLIGVRGDATLGVQNFGSTNNDLMVRPITWTNMSNNPITAGPVSGITYPFWVVNG